MTSDPRRRHLRVVRPDERATDEPQEPPEVPDHAEYLWTSKGPAWAWFDDEGRVHLVLVPPPQV